MLLASASGFSGLGHSTLEMTRNYVSLQTSDLASVHEHFVFAGEGGAVAGVMGAAKRWHYTP
jgi:hypothetical protein